MGEIDNSFEQVARIIETARDNAYRKVNEELILMYQHVGKFLSEKAKEASYGDSYMDSLAAYIQERFPGIKGFNRRGLYRMKQFYELYEGNEKVSALLTQLSWSNHLQIMSGCKSDEEREFYIQLAIKERYTYRQLERQMDSGYYERYMLSREKLLPEKIHSELNPFLDSYVIEFLDLPPKFKEKHLKKGLIEGMKKLYWNSDRTSLMWMRNTPFLSAARIITSTFCSITGHCAVLWRWSLRRASSSQNTSPRWTSILKVSTDRLRSLMRIRVWD